MLYLTNTITIVVLMENLRCFCENYRYCQANPDGFLELSLDDPPKRVNKPSQEFQDEADALCRGTSVFILTKALEPLDIVRENGMVSFPEDAVKLRCNNISN